MSARLDLMDIDGGGETGPSKGEGEAADPASEKIQASLTNVVELLDLFAELTEELSRGKHCRERVVQEASWSSVEKIKALRSRLRSVIPSHMGAGAAGPNAGPGGVGKYGNVDARMDSYVEQAEATLALDKLRLLRTHIEKIAHCL
uniref:Uncharacterized protein n=1 Tax=Chloropicon laureae TaxID=464258 RepID=A0A7S2YYR6_9CHLO|mmetsp:Transcript_12354/g.32041  ORF Transcript_12354/g.32041 Transcript_12354/m.32041 type:complete len:146 (+) Transcript_12354:266-703(+)